MCKKTTFRRQIGINGIPFVIEGCERHAHGIGQIPTPSGARVKVEITRPDERRAIECLANIVRDVSLMMHEARLLPCAELLLLGRSIARPGEPVEAASLATKRRADELALQARKGDPAPAAIVANEMLRGIGLGNKKAEADYTALVRAGLRHGVLIPLVQRAYNTRNRLTARPS